MQNKNKNRKSIRVKEYDYSEAGDYFVTICTHGRECLFGKIVEEEILKTMSIRKEVNIDIFSIMPNHLHMIVSLNDFCHDPVGANGRSPLQCGNQNNFRMKPKSLSSFVSGFKSATTKHINILRGTPSQTVFQRNYYEHIIRNEKSYDEIYSYIESNHTTWDRDRNHPSFITSHFAEASRDKSGGK